MVGEAVAVEGIDPAATHTTSLPLTHPIFHLSIHVIC